MFSIPLDSIFAEPSPVAVGPAPGWTGLDISNMGSETIPKLIPLDSAFEPESLGSECSSKSTQNSAC